MYVEVMSGYLLYTSIVFAYLILHELSHVFAAKILGYNPRIKLVLYKNRIPIAITVVVKEFEKYKSFYEIENVKDKVKYIIIAITPYWLLALALIVMVPSASPIVKISGIVITLSSIINLPLEFLQ